MRESKEKPGDYHRYEDCRKCGHVANDWSNPFNGVCPACGGEDVGQVIGRWWFVWESGFISSHRRNTRFERRGDT